MLDRLDSMLHEHTYLTIVKILCPGSFCDYGSHLSNFGIIPIPSDCYDLSDFGQASLTNFLIEFESQIPILRLMRRFKFRNHGICDSNDLSQIREKSAIKNLELRCSRRLGVSL